MLNKVHKNNIKVSGLYELDPKLRGVLPKQHKSTCTIIVARLNYTASNNIGPINTKFTKFLEQHQTCF